MELHEYSEGDTNRLYPLGKKFNKYNKEQFIQLIEENYELSEIAKKMGWDASYLGNMAKKLIVQEYDFIEQYRNKANKKQRAFGDLQFYLIAQKILNQVLVNTPRSEILESFEGGMTSDVFRSVQRRVLHAQSFSDLRNLARERLLNILILDLNPSKLSEISDDDRCWIPQGSVFKRLKQFYKSNLLVQRILSKKHLQYLEMAKVLTGSIISSDFAMVSIIDPSFADSFLYPLLRKYEQKKHIVGVNINRDVFKKPKMFKKMGLEDIDDELNKRNIEFLAIDKENIPYIFGIKDKISNEIFTILWKGISFTRYEIYLRLDRESEEIDSSIEYLLKKSLIKKDITPKKKFEFLIVNLIKAIIPFIGRSPKKELKKKENEIIDVGHYELSSGVHIKKLYNVFGLLKYPRLTRYIGSYIADFFSNSVDFILTIDTPSNIIISHRIAQRIGRIKSIFAKYSYDKTKFVLHDGFTIEEGEYGLIFIDVVITGSTVKKLIELIKTHKAHVKGICSIFNLAGGSIYFPPHKYESLIHKNEDIFQKSNCPLCQKNESVYKTNIELGDWKW